MKPLVWLGMAAGVLAWAASPELHAPARLLTALLLGPAPAFLMLQAGQLAAVPAPLPRVPLYLTSVITLWLLAGAALAAALTSGFTPHLLGFNPIDVQALLVWTLFGLLAAAAVVSAFKAFGFSESAFMHQLVPTTRAERLLFVLLAVSAGVCEELVFRSFLVPAIWAAAGSLIVAVLLSATVFGVMHAHQRRGGAVRAMLLGLLLTVPFIVTGSIVPSMVAHALIDLIGGLWGARWLLGDRA